MRDSGCSARPAARPGRADPAPAASTSPPLASPCSSIGSPMIWPTRLRGFSEAYGSWKTIWICRRTGRSPARASDQFLAGEPHRARRWRGQLQYRPAQRRFAAAGFADQAQRLARVDVVPADAVDRVDAADLAVDHHSRLDREVLDQVGHLEQRFSRRSCRSPASAGRSGRPRRAAALVRQVEPAAVEVTAPPPSSAAVAREHFSNTCGQRGANRHPGGGSQQRRG